MIEYDTNIIMNKNKILPELFVFLGQLQNNYWKLSFILSIKGYFWPNAMYERSYGKEKNIHLQRRWSEIK